MSGFEERKARLTVAASFARANGHDEALVRTKDLEQVLQALAALSTARPSGEERGWLIESKSPSDGSPQWFKAGPDFNWTKDASATIRFSRREDARQFADWSTINAWPDVAVTEHLWTPPASPDVREKVARLVREAVRDGGFVEDTTDAILALFPSTPGVGEDRGSVASVGCADLVASREDDAGSATPSEGDFQQAFQKHPRLAAKVEALGTCRIEGLSLDDWCSFLAELNAALSEDR